MQTQRDHVHAHQFQMGRMSCALVLGDPTHAQIPGRRTLTGLLVGVLLSVLIIAGFLVYGFIVGGGNKAWTQKGVIVVEKETGNRYVFLNGTLHPVINLTSARLVQGPQAKVVLVSRNSLKAVTRGGAIGLPGSPQAPPEARDVMVGPWLACLPASVSGTANDKVSLNLDPAAPAEPLADGRFVLVVAPDHTRFLVTRSTKHKIIDDTAPVVLGAANVQPVPAASAWLSQLPDGSQIGAAQIDGLGSPGPTVDGRAFPVGQLFRQNGSGSGEQLFVLRRDGLAPLSRMEFMLLQAKTQGAKPIDLDAAAVVAAPRSIDRSLTQRLPDLSAAQWQDHRGEALCLRQESNDNAVASSVVLVAREHSAITAEGEPGVHVKAGSGMVVVPFPVLEKQTGRERFLISEEGARFRLPEDEDVQALGLGGARQAVFPRGLLDLLPNGPVLSRKAVIVSGEG
jgi:type VII secretion protein EccB